VNTAIYFKKPWAKKLINAVLRSYQRQSQNEEDVCLFLQAQASKPSAHPEWLEKKIKRAWSHQADSIFIANNQHPPLTLRVNSQKISRSDYLALLEEKNINAKSALFSDDGIYLESPSPVTELPLFDQGGVSVQDEAAQLAASLLQLEPGQNVLDACCAPGGKTCHIGEKEPLLESLSALDVDERRLHKVRENLARIDIKVNLICGDAAQPATWLSQLPNPSKKFDRILLDAPCSATGIIRRQPDIKLLRQPEQIKTLVELQLKLLKALWPLLDDGGILLYATCSILPEENSQLVERFLAAQSDAGHQTIDASWGVPQAFGRQLLPVDSQIAGASHDGFYYAKLVKR
jgi:16S rRNA (cytosine967-C5)-methyltransferase